MSYTRIPDRRKSRREGDDVGRRARKRFVLQDHYVVKIITGERQVYCADMLDISLSGIYLVVILDQWMPVKGQSVGILFQGSGDRRDAVVNGKIKYTKQESLFGVCECGLGICFDSEISSLLLADKDGGISLVGNKLLTHESEQVKVPK